MTCSQADCITVVQCRWLHQQIEYTDKAKTGGNGCSECRCWTSVGEKWCSSWVWMYVSLLITVLQLLARRDARSSCDIVATSVACHTTRDTTAWHVISASSSSSQTSPSPERSHFHYPPLASSVLCSSVISYQQSTQLSTHAAAAAAVVDGVVIKTTQSAPRQRDWVAQKCWQSTVEVAEWCQKFPP